MIHTYREVSGDIVVEASPFYVPEKSDEDNNFYFYAYTIRIINKNQKPFRLLKRYWIIKDGLGNEGKVEGDGVVGEIPRIYPGKEYSYTSFCPLQTPTGNMRGRYELEFEGGDKKVINIPLFFLRRPETFH